MSEIDPKPADKRTKAKFLDEVAEKIRGATQVLLVCEYPHGVELNLMQPEHGLLSVEDDTNQLRILMSTQRMCESIVRNQFQRKSGP